jgi:tRNA-dihydrouridine synthase B
MAGITDKPFRDICRRFGAGLTTSEMVASKSNLWKSEKTRQRLVFSEDEFPRSVQIVGSDPVKMAEAARFNVDNGAQIIDINMGCPAKKVCHVAAGSALLRNEILVSQILDAVTKSVTVPVTLKIRTGWSKANINGLSIAKIAENSGISAIAVHGRTRECMFSGEAGYEVIANIKSSVSIPVIVNGDIVSPEKARQVLDFTAADAVMVGRAAQGNPWLFREINTFLETGEKLDAPTLSERCEILSGHIKNLYRFYGEYRGLRIARKHINWYCSEIEGYTSFRKVINKIDSANEQLELMNHFFQQLIIQGDRAA